MVLLVSCYSQRKVKNSESKSQQKGETPMQRLGCYSQRKVKNSESKSQHRVCVGLFVLSCYSQRKVKNSESKSQLCNQLHEDHRVVIHSVKLKILKANHNVSPEYFLSIELLFTA